MRRNEEEGPGGPDPDYFDYDASGSLSVGGYNYTAADYRLTAAERAQWRRELKEREARRIPMGFQLPSTP